MTKKLLLQVRVWIVFECEAIFFFPDKGVLGLLVDWINAYVSRPFPRKECSFKKKKMVNIYDNGVSHTS